ncbi:2,3-dimethylmalate lyase [bacterium HR23]|nr:2,3-dimethylmalate lyase [bacterium HR23]
MNLPRPTTRLRHLLHRQGKVLTVVHPPSAYLAKVMEMAGVEAGFIGTSAVVGFCTGLADVGVASLTECLQVAEWIARSVRFPVILDGDTGHGGIMAVRRMVRECIRRGVAGVRIDDQPIERKRGTGSAGIWVEDLDIVLARYRAAVEMRNELDPDFVVMAQCYAGEAQNSTFEDALRRMRAYKEVGVDWVQFSAPRSVEEIRIARQAIPGPFSVMFGHLPRPLTHRELLELGITIAWATVPVHQVISVALYDFLRDYMERDTQAVQDFRQRYAEHPLLRRGVPLGVEGEDLARLRELEARYFPPPPQGMPATREARPGDAPHG